MIQQTKHDAGGDTARSGSANSAEPPVPSGQVKGAVDGALRMMAWEKAPPASVSAGIPEANARTLEAYVARRKKLAARIRAENPDCTEEEIEARLEQFGV